MTIKEKQVIKETMNSQIQYMCQLLPYEKYTKQKQNQHRNIYI